MKHSALLCLLLLLLTAHLHCGVFAQTNNNKDNGLQLDYSEISYVLEPFEFINDQYNNSINIANNNQSEVAMVVIQQSNSTAALFGRSALKIEYSIDGNNSKFTRTTMDESEFATLFGLEFIEPRRSHNCYGANHLSIWYQHLVRPKQNDPSKNFNNNDDDDNNNKVINEDSYSITFRMSVFDDTNCTLTRHPTDCTEALELELYSVIEYPLPTKSSSNGWQEIRVPLDDQVADLNVRGIRGWKFELLLSSDYNKTDAMLSNSVHSLYLDQLACVGGGEMIDAMFHPANDKSLDQLLQDGYWQNFYHKSPLSEEQTVATLPDDGVLDVQYVSEQTEVWGGYLQHHFHLPGHAYFNLSLATELVFDYSVAHPSSNPGRAVLRLVLGDISACDTKECLEHNNDHEHYYSFFPVLDTSTEGDFKQLRITLEGGTSSSSPFWLTGWSGSVGDSKFDVQQLKSFNWQIVIDGNSDIGSIVSGSISIKNFAAIQTVPPTEMSYVIDPLDSIDKDWWTINADDPTSIIVSDNGNVLFGRSSISMHLSKTGFGSIQNRQPHNCYSSSHFSIWYKIPEPVALQNLRLRVTMYDDSGCVQRHMGPTVLCHDINQLNSFVVIDQEIDDKSKEWKELRGSGSWNMELTRLRGWKIEVLAPEAPSLALSDGIILLGRLACEGSGQMFGAPLHISNHLSFQDAVIEGTWNEIYFKSDLAERNTTRKIDENNGFQLEYTVKVAELWGGFNDYAHVAPGRGFYDISGASDLMLDYHVYEAASPSDLASFRVTLYDGSDCTQDCGSYNEELEHYYSFHNILDEEGEGQLLAPLEGSTDSTSSFWLSGWSGITGNSKFDLSQMKGYGLQISLSDQGEIGSFVTGAVTVKNLAAFYEPTNSTSNGESAADCVYEQDLYIIEGLPQMTQHSFQSRECCDVCAQEPDCLYSVATGIHCYTAPYLYSGDVGLLNTYSERSTIKSYWSNDASKRGDFCALCDCNKDKLKIDCRGKDLAIIPMTFTQTSWEPKSLDLSDNPRLVILGDGSLSQVKSSLEVIWLPESLRHISKRALQDIPNLSQIYFEGFDSGSAIQIGQPTEPVNNVISGQFDSFGDICCGRGRRIDTLEAPDNGLTFCNMEVNIPGIDSVYEPFNQYLGPKVLLRLIPDSPFMSEASESVEKCAEYCTISTECNYFAYDNRISNAEPRCFLLETDGVGNKEVCCDKDHYADEEQTIPGWTTGFPPRTRHREMNAAVVISSQNLVANDKHDFTVQFVVSLGSTPLRGAVWVEPVLAAVSSSSSYDIEITPSKIALYDANTSVTFTIKVLNVSPKSSSTTLVIEPQITSCDTAFTTTSPGTILLHVSPPRSIMIILVACIGALLFLLLLVGIYFYSRRNKVDDSIWKVKREELHFDDPPEVVGRGTFGLVLLAEYRGTNVAVKRAIPPKSRRAANDNTDTLNAAFGLPEVEVDDTSDSTTHSAVLAAATNNNNNVEPSSSQFDADMEKLEAGSKSGLHASRSGILSNTSPGILDAAEAVGDGGGTSTRVGALGTSLMSKFSRGVYTMRGSSQTATWNKLRADFIQEMRYLSTLRHPCITTVMGAVIGGPQVEPMLVMEFMDHGSLYDVLHNDTILLEGDLLLPIMRDISQGLRFLHAADPIVIHGDLKAQNILVDNKFRAKVADFGLSQKKHVGATGTPYWMAPELLRGESTNTSASDVYSFGIILYEVYSRREPYEGEDTKEVLRLVADKAVCKRPPVPDSCPPLVQSLFLDCIVDDATERPTSEELNIRLKRIKDAKHVEPEHQNTLKKKNIASISLFDIFPKKIAEALRDGRTVEAEHRDIVTIFFSDIVGYTNISSSLSPHKVANMLDRLYSKFDTLSDEHDIFKVETIGDAYMAVTNLVKDQPDDHAKRIADFAIDAIAAANDTLIDIDDPSRGTVDIRVGFHCGPVVADVVGNRNPRYCLFGDAVNTASRMETSSKPNRIHCSDRAADILKEQYPSLPMIYRGCIDVKGKGEMDTFWVNEKVRKKSSYLLKPPKQQPQEEPTPTKIKSIRDDIIALKEEEQVSQFVDGILKTTA